MSKLPKANRIKPTVFKDKAYLSYMHNSEKTCVIYCDCNIELHHLKDRNILGRDDSKVVPLCPEHHRGRYSPHGADAKEFYDKNTKMWLLVVAEEFYKEFTDGK